jgi:hypothetical protein
MLVATGSKGGRRWQHHAPLLAGSSPVVPLLQHGVPLEKRQLRLPFLQLHGCLTVTLQQRQSPFLEERRRPHSTTKVSHQRPTQVTKLM